jgi:dolichyl-phosphate beta-glucosyltransferase
MFTRSAARSIFPSMHVEGFIFDIEVLLLAKYLGIPIVEVPVAWEEKDGSTLNLVRDSIRMARDLLILRLNYSLGFWSIPRPPASSSFHLKHQ